MSVAGRKVLFLSLIVVFFFQTWLVYSDPIGRESPPLSAQAAAGRAIWHDHNCQSCHQLYGFGGFLGPDLTNAAADLTESRLESVLTTGATQMPAFHLDPEQRAAILQFLVEVNETGVGQLRLAAPPSAREILDGVVESVLAEQADAEGAPEVVALSGPEQVGRELVMRENCIDCHLPNSRSAYRSPDMTTLVARLSGPGVLAIVSAGIPAKAMPRITMTEQEEAGLIAFLEWMAVHEEPIHDAFTQAAASSAGDGARIPWFEYR